MRAAIIRGLSCVTLITCLSLVSACSVLGQAKPAAFKDAYQVSMNCIVLRGTTCQVTLLNVPRSHHDLQWSFSSSAPAGAAFSPQSGTLKVGATQDITATYPTSEPCPITVSLLMARVGSDIPPPATRDLTWRCES
jgi:hypothetical protein